VDLSGLLTPFEALEPYRLLRESLAQGETLPPLALMRSARAPLLAALAQDSGRPMLVVAGSVERAKGLAQSLRDWLPPEVALIYFPEPLALFYERAPWTEEVIADRLRVLNTLRARAEASFSTPLIIVASVRALMQRTLPVREFRVSTRQFRLGQVLDLERTLRRWAGLGYEPVSVVEAPGQFSRRGGILDIFPPADELPVRMELFGDQIDSLRRFEPATQRSQERVDAITVTPAREALPRYGPRVAEHVAAQLERDLSADVEEELEHHVEGLHAAAPFRGLEFYLPYFYTHPATLLDYLPEQALLVVDDQQRLQEAWAEMEEEALALRESARDEGALPPEYPLPYVTWSEWAEEMTDRLTLSLGHTAVGPDSLIADHFVPVPHFGSQLKRVLQHIESAQYEGARVVVVSQQAQRLAELWGAEHEYVAPLEDVPQLPEQPLAFVHGALAEGWTMRGLDLGHSFSSFQLLTDAEVFGWHRPEPRRPIRRRKVAPETFFSDLEPGDFVVHVEHGIGVFRGLVTRRMEGTELEYLLVEYGQDDRLYVPIYQADRLSRYIGADDRPPRLNRLGKARWRSVKERAQKAAEAVAKDLLELYAARRLVDGYRYGPDTTWQAELEASFPYFETEDQLEAIAEVKTDMESVDPMDRLICGDVGYGKTEVALRAAFKAVMAGKQVSVLVPTTVLAQQHYVTFRERLSPFPVEVEMLSRFRSRAEQRDVLERLIDHQVDIVIGTHRLLQPDVQFADLGLLIIDEEQRFGVTHKERLKQMRTQVDVLTLTATPIPRTLYMALTGVRDISTIQTPPEERLPVNTYVGRYEPQLVRRAILRELDRGGQVFYVHNRVETIQSVRHRLERLVPEAEFGVGHGQMRESTLEQTMKRFVAGEVDVLVCTSIIESGLDIPNANTLIIERADRFGLAQLYQLRGRVGRGAQRAYAYFFYDRLSRLTSEARQRLETIREASELGSGYAIAMRDLEIRGAGDILGTRQSGHISAVGFDLYTRLLGRAVRELKAAREGEPPPPEPLGSVRIDLPIPARLPESYVPDVGLRLKIYRRMADLQTWQEIGDMERELNDRFGPLPELAQNLMYQLRLKALARDAGIRSIGIEHGRLALKSGRGPFANRRELQASLRGRASVSREGIWMGMDSGWREDLVGLLEQIGGIVKA